MRANIRYVQNSGQERAEELERQKATQKAETLAKYGDFSGYGALGYTPEEVQSMKSAWDAQNSKPEEYGGLGSYARTLLDLYENNAGFDIEQNLQQALENGLITQRDYQAALIAARGIVAGSGAKKTKGSTGGTGGTGGTGDYTPEEQAAAGRAKMLPDGRFSVSDPGDWRTLMGYYSRNGMLSSFASQFVFEPVNNTEQVYVPGYGKMSYEEAERLVAEGAVTVTGQDENGDPVFARTTGGGIYAVTK